MGCALIGHLIMNLDNEIRNILFKIGQDIKVHKLQDGHLILDIDYEKYVKEFVELFNKEK
jgi:hypothetical protein